MIRVLTLAILPLLAGAIAAQSLDEKSLISALQEGGYVIVMRHASSPRQVPNADTANPDNPQRERQLDESGRNDAIAMGEAIRKLGIPITEVESSPTYRTLETARMAGFRDVQIRDYLGNQGMQASSEAATNRFLENLAIVPRQGNRLLITHAPNIAAAFPGLSPEIEQGEALVIDPSSGVTEPVARIRISRWPTIGEL